MKIYFSKQTIIFQILSELSAWNGFVCSPELKKKWLSQSGGALRKDEKVALNNFSNALRNGPDDAWVFLLSANKQEKNKKIFDLSYAPIFSAISECEKIIKTRINILLVKYFINEKKQVSQINGIIKNSKSFFTWMEKFTDCSPVKNFSLHIGLSKPSGFEAWAYTDKKIIIFPPKKNQMKLLIKTMIHEYGHLLARNNNKLVTKIQKITGNFAGNKLDILANKIGLPPEVIIEELFFSSLTPEGWVGYSIDKKEWTLSKRATLFEKMRKDFSKSMRLGVQERFRGNISFNSFLEIFQEKLNKVLK